MDTIRPPLEWNQLFIQYSSTLNCIERELRTDADCKEFAENISAFASYCKPFSIVKEVSSLSEDCPYIAIPAIPYQHEPNETNPEVCYHYAFSGPTSAKTSKFVNGLRHGCMTREEFTLYNLEVYGIKIRHINSCQGDPTQKKKDGVPIPTELPIN